MNDKGRKMTAKAALVVTAAYVLTGTVVLQLQSHSNIVTPVIFIPEGIALYAAIQWGWRALPTIALAQALLATINGVSIPNAILLGLSNGVINCSASSLTKRIGIRYPVQSTRDLINYLIVIGLVAQPLSATIGSWIIGSEGINAWLSWWCGNTAAQSSVTILLINAKGAWQDLKRPRSMARLATAIGAYISVLGMSVKAKIAGPWAIPLIIEPILLIGSINLGNIEEVAILSLVVQLALGIQQWLFNGDLMEGVQLGMAMLLANIYCLYIGMVLMEERELRSQLESRSKTTEYKLRLSRVASSISHEINGPLALLRLKIEQWETESSSSLERDERRHSATEIMRQISDQTSRIRSILQLVKSTGSKSTCKIDDVFRLLKIQATGSRNRRLSLKVDEKTKEAKIGCDRGVMTLLLDNLIRNAEEADQGNGGKTGVVKVSATTEKASGMILLSVSDSGPGFLEEARENVLIGPYSSKERGTGTGLFLVQEVVRQLGGTVAIKDSAEGGALVELLIPEAKSG